MSLLAIRTLQVVVFWSERLHCVLAQIEKVSKRRHQSMSVFKRPLAALLARTCCFKCLHPDRPDKWINNRCSAIAILTAFLMFHGRVVAAVAATITKLTTCAMVCKKVDVCRQITCVACLPHRHHSLPCV